MGEQLKSWGNAGIQLQLSGISWCRMPHVKFDKYHIDGYEDAVASMFYLTIVVSQRMASQSVREAEKP